MANLAYQTVNNSGGGITPVASSAGGDSVPANSRGALMVRNGSATSVTVTLVVPGSAYGQARPDVAYTIAAGGVAVIGPLVPDLAQVDGYVDFTYSAVTTVTSAAIFLSTP